MSIIFKGRAEAGRKLARKLGAYSQRQDAIVLALPPGGVAVGYEVAVMLGLPLDVLVVAKLPAPGHPEIEVGAIGPGGITILDEPLIAELGICGHEMVDEANALRVELERRQRAYRGVGGTPDLKDKVVIVVDDALATGAKMKAAIESARRLGAERVVAAVPVGPASTCRELRKVADDVVCLHSPQAFHRAAELYLDFAPVSDEQVRTQLEEAEALTRLQHCNVSI